MSAVKDIKTFLLGFRFRGSMMMMTAKGVVGLPN